MLLGVGILRTLEGWRRIDRHYRATAKLILLITAEFLAIFLKCAIIMLSIIKKNVFNVFSLLQDTINY